MNLRSLEIFRVEIPFRQPFEHASARREVTESIWVEARGVGPHVGYGEGCPRLYVTGESMHTAVDFLEQHRKAVLEGIHGLDELRQWVIDHRATIDENPAAWCAAELALLDLLAKEQGRTVEGLLGIGELRGEFRYTAVVGSGERSSVRETVREYRKLGFKDFKIKLTGDVERDREALQELGAGDAAKELRVRADFNNAFADEGEALQYLDSLSVPLFALEEPLAPGQHQALSRLAEHAAAPIVLDESLIRCDQLDALVGSPEGWIINLRVSKMGGVLRSLELLEQARSRGIRVIVGAQVGETSLLTRAGLTLAEQARDILVAQEGAFGRHLLKDDVCDPSIQFGFGGVLRAEAATGTRHGLGIVLDEAPAFLIPAAPH